MTRGADTIGDARAPPAGLARKERLAGVKAVRLSEDECLDEVMRLRFGDAPCPACAQAARFVRQSRHRAFSCRSCGFKLYPCQGTPFAKPVPPLRHWFAAIHLEAKGGRGVERRLRRQLGIGRRPSEQLARAVRMLKAQGTPDGEPAWFDGIAAFAAAHPTASASGRGTSDRETLWQTLRAGLASLELDRRPLLGIGAIAALAILGAGVGWMMVPAPPQEDTELEQATAVLTLGEKKPVILVTPEVAAQLYDVSDADADPNSPLASSFRVADTVDGKTDIAKAKPMTAPAIKLSDGVGKSLLEGNTNAVKAKGQDRPELAAYSSLARELESKGPQNPDELLVFGPMKIRRYLVEKIMQAARTVSVDPVLLMAIADKESAFRTEVQAQTSSASGLFQFIEKTWLGVVREFGSRYGMEKEARALAGGDVSGAERSRILDLRRDPYLSAVLAAEMLRRDSLRIEKKIGRPLTGGEVYLVHFLGPDGAERMIDQINRKPDAEAAELLPRPAAANRTIFYGSGANGSSGALSVSEVRGKFETMMAVRLERYRAVKRAPGPRPPQHP